MSIKQTRFKCLEERNSNIYVFTINRYSQLKWVVMASASISYRILHIMWFILIDFQETILPVEYKYLHAWWRHQMETFSALLAFCAGNSPVTCLNKRLSKQWWDWWFEMPSRSLWRHCNGNATDVSVVGKINRLRPGQNSLHFADHILKMFDDRNCWSCGWKFRWNLFPRVELKINLHWFMSWLGDQNVPNLCLNNWWYNSLTHMGRNAITSVIGHCTGICNNPISYVLASSSHGDDHFDRCWNDRQGRYPKFIVVSHISWWFVARNCSITFYCFIM